MIKDRLTKGWNFWRAAFLIIGILMVLQAAHYGQWLGVALGLYMLFMGLLGFGCAGGSCYNGSCGIPARKDKED